MKTIREWLEELPEPWRSSALRQADTKRLARKVESLAGAVCGFGNWGKTTEGVHKWWALGRHIESGEPMPIHPTQEQA